MVSPMSRQEAPSFKAGRFTYRIVKRSSWWTSIFDTSVPQYLYFDFDTEHFEVASYQTARKYKWEFNKEEIDLISKEPGFEQEFFVENVREEEKL